MVIFMVHQIEFWIANSDYLGKPACYVSMLGMHNITTIPQDVLHLSKRGPHGRSGRNLSKSKPPVRQLPIWRCLYRECSVPARQVQCMFTSALGVSGQLVS